MKRGQNSNSFTLRIQKIGLFTAFAGMGGTASIIPAIIPLTAQNSNVAISEYLGVVPSLFFGLLLGVLLSTLLLRTSSAAAMLSFGSLAQFASLVAITFATDSSTFAILAGVAGVGFGLCEASGSIMTRVLAGTRTTGLLSALTGTVALVAALGPLSIVLGFFGTNADPLLNVIALCHLATAVLFFVSLGSGSIQSNTATLSDYPKIRHVSLFLLIAPVSAALFIYVGVETIFAGWSAVIPAVVLALDANTAAAGTSIFWILMAAGRYATWFILKTTVTPSAVLVTACSFATICLVLAAIFRLTYPTAALVAVCGAVVCLGPLYSLILGIGLTRVKVKDAKIAVGLLVACGAAGGAFIPTAIISATYSPGSVGVFVAASLLTVTIMPLIVRRRPQHLLPD